VYVGEHVLEDAALSVEITLSHLYPGDRSVHTVEHGPNNSYSNPKCRLFLKIDL
jgi:hypothetical protein